MTTHATNAQSSNFMLPRQRQKSMLPLSLLGLLLSLYRSDAQGTDIYTTDEDLVTGSWNSDTYEIEPLVGHCQHDGLYFSSRYTTSGQLTRKQVNFAYFSYSRFDPLRPCVPKCKAWCDAAGADCVGYSYSLRPGRDCGHG